MASKDLNSRPKVFISYRRDDSSGHAGRIYDMLSFEFGASQIFLDVEDIEAGTDFTMTLKDRINWCDVMLVIIGKSWLTSTNAEGILRIQLADDPVCMEISLAMQRKIPVIPVLVGNARMPSDGELSNQLSSFATHQAIALPDMSFRLVLAHELVPRLERIGTNRAKREKEEAKKQQGEAGPQEFEEGSNWASIG